MKRVYCLLMLLMSLVILTGCKSDKKEELDKKVEVEFVELKYDEESKDPYIVYVSHDEKKYFSRHLEKYEYDFQLEEFKTIKELRKSRSISFSGPYYLYHYIPEEDISKEEKNKDESEIKKYRFKEYE